MSDQNKIQFESSVSSEGAESGFKRIGDAAGQMADRVEREVDKAGTAVSVIGSGAEKSADQFTRAEGRMAASIKRATTNLELLGKTASQKLEFQINERGLDAAKFEPMLAKMREIERQAQQASSAGSASLNKIGMSAAQTAAAMRSVPAQFTDIVVSLQSGQAPMTVLLQQGGQLKDMFGGVGNAAKALGGYVASLVTPLTVVAAGAAAVGYAFYSGRTESDEFRKNLILTGNASGLTTDKFNAMAAAMGNVSGITRGAAAEALTAMAASGNIGATSIQKLTEAALKFEKAGGPAVADTAKQFEELGKSPVDASVKLSEKTHYLTLAVYEQIKSLEQQGKTSEAAAVAQKAWADAIDQRTPQMVQNIGYIETAWKGVKDAVSGAIDAAKGWGRDETTAEKMLRLQREAGRAQMGMDDPTRYTERSRLKEIRDAAQAELAEMVSGNKAKEAEAKRSADIRQKEDARIAATSGVDKLIESQRSKREQYSAELEKLNKWRAVEIEAQKNNADALLKVEEKYQQAKAALAKKYEEKPRAAKADKVENAYNSILDSLNKQLGSAEKLNAVEKLNVELQEKKYAKLSPLQKENLLLIAQQIDLQKRAEVEGKATLQWIADGADDQKKALKSLNDEIEKTSREVATYGMSRAEVATYDISLIDEQIAAEKALNEEIGVGSSELLRSLELQRDKRKQILDQARKLDQLDAGKAAAEQAKKAAEEAAAAWQKTVDAIDQTFHDGFTRMLENGKADWEAFGKALANSFKTAVADEIYKLTIKPIVINVVSSFVGGGQPGVAGSAQQGIGVLSGLQTAYANISGGITNAANSFAMSGFGQAAGLSTAQVGAATQAGPALVSPAALTGSGSALVSAAAPVAAAAASAAVIDGLQKAGWGPDNNLRGYLRGMAPGMVMSGSGLGNGLTTGLSGVNAALFSASAIGTLGANVILDRLFGHNRNVSDDARGIRGTFDLSGFAGENYQERSQKGGAFRSDRRWTDPSAIDADMDKALDSMLKQTVSGLQTIGKTLDVESVKALEGFSHQFQLQLSDNGDMSKAGEKIAAEIAKVSDEMVNRLVPNIAEFAQYGETATQTFQRLNQEVTATDAILLAMGKDASEAFGAVGLASIKAREDLIDLAGGLDKLASKTQAYYANFYTSDEQMQRAAEQAQKVLNKGFAELSLPLPTDRKGFRDLVESYGKDLSTDGARKLFNALLDLQDEFDAVADVAEADAKKIKDATTAAQQGQASLFDTFASDAQKLESANKLVNDTFASIGKAVPSSASDFLKLEQAIDPASEAGQSLIKTLEKVSGAFSYVQTSASAAAAAVTQARATQRSVADSYDPAGAVARAQADINAAFGRYGATAPTDQAGLAAVASGIDASTEMGRQQLSELQSLTGAFNTVFSARDSAIANRTQAASGQRSLQDSFDPSGAVARAQADIAAAFAKYGATVPTSRAGVADVAASINTSTSLGVEQMAALQSLSGAFDTVFSAQERAAQASADAAKSAADAQARAAQDAIDNAQRAAAEQSRLASQVHDSISSALKSLLGQSEQWEQQTRQMAQATIQSALAIAKAGGSLSNFQGLDAALESVTKLDKATFATAAGYAVEFGRTANLLTQLEQYTRINGSHENGLDYVPFDGYVAQLHKGERVQTAASAAAADATVEEVKALRQDLNAIGAALASYTQKTAKLMAKFDVEGIPARV